MVQRIFDHAEASDPLLHAFMQTHCAHLLTPGPDTGIAVAALDPVRLTDSTVQLLPRYSSSLVLGPKYDSGIYTLFNPSTGSTYYGSCSYFGSRLDLHYHEYHQALATHASGLSAEQSSSDESLGSQDSAEVGEVSSSSVGTPGPVKEGSRLYRDILADGGIEAFRWGVVAETPNYWKLLLTERPELGSSGAVRRMIEELAAYERRMIELSIIDYAHPSLNSSGVTFTTTWVPGAAGSSSSPMPVVVGIEDHTSLPLPSKNAAAKMLEVDRTTIDAALDKPGKLIWSPAYQAHASVSYDTAAAAAVEADVPLSELPFDLHQLPLRQVQVYNKDWELVGVGSSPQACLEDYQVSGHSLRKYLNRRFILGAVSGASTLLYFALNPAKGRWNPVVQTNVVTGVTTEYSAVSTCVKAVTGKTSGSGRAAFIKRYIDGGDAYQGVYTFHYKFPKGD